MISVRSPVCIAAAVSASLLAAAPAAAAPRPGERYDGFVEDNNNVVVVSRDGAALEWYLFVSHVQCSDGRVRALGVTGERLPIAGDGSFVYDYPPAVLEFGDGVRGRADTDVAGRFADDGQSVSGTITSRFRSSRYDCDARDVPFTLHLDGTPGAPFSNDVATTAGYRAVHVDGGFSLYLRPFVPARLLDRVRIRYKARCRSGGVVRDVIDEYGIPFRPDGTFRDRYRFRAPVRGGGRVLVRLALRGRLFRRGTEYTVDGSWSIRLDYRLPGRRETCRVGGPFHGGAGAS